MHDAYGVDGPMDRSMIRSAASFTDGLATCTSTPTARRKARQSATLPTMMRQRLGEESEGLRSTSPPPRHMHGT